MLMSFALILLSGLLFSWTARKVHLPGLAGMIAAGLLIGPCLLNLLDADTLAISASLRKMALTIIILKAGLSLNLSDLKKAGLSAVFLTFVPATFEIAGYTLFGMLLFHLPWQQSALMGTVMSAVSPAVVVPGMTKMIDEKVGTDRGIPQMILAGASMDDIYVLVLFSCLMTLNTSSGFSALTLAGIPVSILTGIGAGLLFGAAVNLLFRKVKLSSMIRFITVLGISFFLMGAEDLLKPYFAFSGLLAVMAMGMTIKAKGSEKTAASLQKACSEAWKPAEIILFVLVGAAVQFQSVDNTGWMAVLLIFLCLLVRMLGTWTALLPSRIPFKEKLFIMGSYIPKATVQAAIGSLPAAAGISSGDLILSVAVLSILITAPLGAFWIEASQDRLVRDAEV